MQTDYLFFKWVNERLLGRGEGLGVCDLWDGHLHGGKCSIRELYNTICIVLLELDFVNCINSVWC